MLKLKELWAEMPTTHLRYDLLEYRETSHSQGDKDLVVI